MDHLQGTSTLHSEIIVNIRTKHSENKLTLLYSEGSLRHVLCVRNAFGF